MNKGINYATYELKTKVFENIKESGLPIVNVKYAIEQILNEISVAEQNAIMQEKASFEAEENKEEK